MEGFFGSQAWCIVALAASFVSASSFFFVLSDWLKRWRLLSKCGLGQETIAARLLQRGVYPLMPISCLLCDSKLIRRVFEELTEFLMLRGYVVSKHSVGSVALLLLAVALVLSLVATGSFVASLALPLCAVAALLVLLAADRDKREESLRDSVPDALQSMSACFRAGLSLLQTLHQVASEISGPLQKYFQRAAYRLETGGSVEDALEVLKNAGSPELSFVAIALDVQHESGGSMQKVLDSAREAVESQIELSRTLRVQTAQAKLSARVVSLMPFALIALFSLVSPGFLEPFFASAAGIALLLLALSMQLAGVLLVRRMLNVGVR